MSLLKNVKNSIALILVMIILVLTNSLGTLVFATTSQDTSSYAFTEVDKLLVLKTPLVAPVTAPDESIWYASSPNLAQSSLTGIQIKVNATGKVSFFNQDSQPFDGVIQLPDQLVTFYDQQGKVTSTQSKGKGDLFALSGKVNLGNSVLSLTMTNETTQTTSVDAFVYDSTSASFIEGNNQNTSDSDGGTAASSSSSESSSSQDTSAASSSKSSTNATTSAKNGKTQTSQKTDPNVVYINSQAKSKVAYTSRSAAKKAGTGSVESLSKKKAEQQGYQIRKASKVPDKTEEKKPVTKSKASKTQNQLAQIKKKPTKSKKVEKINQKQRWEVVGLLVALLAVITITSLKIWQKWQNILKISRKFQNR